MITNVYSIFIPNKQKKYIETIILYIDCSVNKQTIEIAFGHEKEKTLDICNSMEESQKLNRSDTKKLYAVLFIIDF